MVRPGRAALQGVITPFARLDGFERSVQQQSGAAPDIHPGPSGVPCTRRSCLGTSRSLSLPFIC